jgi:two-component system, NtrC family, sensor histidine kinase HydH
VVHEIRNPLSAIKMNLRILETKVESADSSVAVHFQIAKQQTERLETMLTDLLDYAKPLELHRKDVSLPDFLREVVAGFQPEADRHGVQIELKLEALPCHASVDPEKMQQVLWNLLLNAVQFSVADSRISVLCEEDHSVTPPRIRLAVRDFGKGISTDNLKHVFEPFFTTRKQGTGLGLPNARKIVEAHGGHIQISSWENKGTVVTIDLLATTTAPQHG